MTELGLFQTDALVEKLAKVFCRLQGYVVRDDYRMQDSNHPRVKICVAMAFTAIEEVEFELAGAEDEDEVEAIKWQQGQDFTEGRQYYFCKHGQFTLTLLTDTQLNLTRGEVFLEKITLYRIEEEITKEEATEKLQEFLSGLAGQLQTLSRIEF